MELNFNKNIVYHRQEFQELKIESEKRNGEYSTVEELLNLVKTHQNYLIDYDKMKISGREKFSLPLFVFGNTLYIVAGITTPDNCIDYWKEKYSDKTIKLVFLTKRDMSTFLRNLFKDSDTENSTNLFHTRVPHRSAKIITLSDLSKITLLIIPILILFAYAAWNKDFSTLEIVLTTVFSLTFIVKFLLTVLRFSKSSTQDYEEITEFPMYSILVPLYKEKKILKKLKDNLMNLDYPSDKLDIKLVFEETDTETIDYAKTLKFPDYFDFILVPKKYPTTKPRACNYALPYCNGEFVVIFDAEDNPDPDQLKKVVGMFKTSPENIACIQSALNWYNREDGWLVNCFAIEYMQWFKFLLPGLQNTNTPIPLGGTSNHFKRKILLKLGGWDSYNVTEDAELGVRLFENNYKTLIADSTTWEEAPAKILSWIKQRSRWVKGHMVTFSVYLRKSKSANKLNLREKIMFLTFLGLPILSFIFTLPALIFASWAISTDNLLHDGLQFFLWVLFIPNIAGIVLNAVCCIIEKEYKLLPYTLILPFYWILHGVSSLLALYELYITPHSWRKTDHGN